MSTANFARSGTTFLLPHKQSARYPNMGYPRKFSSFWMVAIALLVFTTICHAQDVQRQARIVETIRTDFGEPQAVLNHEEEITRQKIRETQQYMAAHDSWKKTCLNRHQLCSFWAAKGECASNKSWMRGHCAASCRRCLIPSGYRYPSDLIVEQKPSVAQQSSHIMVAIPYGESQVLPTTNADPVVQTISKMTKYMQQKLHVEENYASVRTDCTCKNSKCALWASQGEGSCVALHKLQCLCDLAFVDRILRSTLPK
jgi:hypothetical protein